jgi:hypothetical protein
MSAAVVNAGLGSCRWTTSGRCTTSVRYQTEGVCDTIQAAVTPVLCYAERALEVAALGVASGVATGEVPIAAGDALGLVEAAGVIPPFGLAGDMGEPATQSQSTLPTWQPHWTDHMLKDRVCLTCRPSQGAPESPL